MQTEFIVDLEILFIFVLINDKSLNIYSKFKTKLNPLNSSDPYNNAANIHKCIKYKYTQYTFLIFVNNITVKKKKKWLDFNT